MSNILQTRISADMKAFTQLLRDACESRALLHIHIAGGESRQFVTRFQELDEEGNIVVEPPVSAHETASLMSADRVTFSFVFKFNKYTFESRCTGQNTEGLAGILLACPARIEKIELRNYYRLRLEDDRSIAVFLSKGNLPDTPVEGRIVDMSEGGVSCEVPLAKGIEQGAWVDSVQFVLPNGYVVVTSGTIRRVSPLRSAPGESLWLCGLEFGHLDRTDRFALVDFIFEKQREEIRKKKHLL